MFPTVEKKNWIEPLEVPDMVNIFKNENYAGEWKKLQGNPIILWFPLNYSYRFLFKLNCHKQTVSHGCPDRKCTASGVSALPSCAGHVLLCP